MVRQLLYVVLVLDYLLHVNPESKKKKLLHVQIMYRIMTYVFVAKDQCKMDIAFWI